MPVKYLPGGKLVLTALGLIFLIAGMIGLILPLLPTTPLVLVSAWCFSRGNPRLHRFLINNKIFGPLIEHWSEHRAIRRKAKVSATLAIMLFFGYTLVFTPILIGVKCLLAFMGVALLVFIWSRPENSQQKRGVLIPRKKT